jgi:EcsC family protein
MRESHVETGEPGERIADVLLELIGRVPDSTQIESSDPKAAARRLARRVAQRAALASGSLALPPGVLGWLTILPELVAVWRLQSQMVADIAALYGTDARPTREQMVYCLFRHTAAQAVRDLAVRMGQRVLVQQVSVNVLQNVARQIGVRLTRHAIGKGVARWVPVVGAVGVGAYAYFDTMQVAFTATQLFQKNARPGKTASPPLLPRTQRF